MAELNHASAGTNPESKQFSSPEAQEAAIKARDLAAKYYLMSAEQGDIVGLHWIGVFYHEGFGVAKNIPKAVEYLQKAADAGNGQSMYQLFIIHSGKEGQDASHKDAVKAYDYLMDAIINGVTFFDEAISFFKANYEQIAPHYVKAKKLPVEVKEESKQEILNMHDAFIGELKVAFSAALGKDRLYHRPCGFLNDQQIWMVGVQLKYMFDNVLRFNHSHSALRLCQSNQD